jgi:hypothetical protein
MLRLTAEIECEGTVRWAAPKLTDTAAVQVVSTVVAPAQRIGPGRFEIPHNAVRQMSTRLRELSLVNVAQLHTHPGDCVGHSGRDDECAYSRRDGALSIVWPEYGCALPPLERWGVHECRGGRWMHLVLNDVRKRILIVPSLIDLRGGDGCGTLEESEHKGR